MEHAFALHLQQQKCASSCSVSQMLLSSLDHACACDPGKLIHWVLDASRAWCWAALLTPWPLSVWVWRWACSERCVVKSWLTKREKEKPLAAER